MTESNHIKEQVIDVAHDVKNRVKDAARNVRNEVADAKQSAESAWRRADRNEPPSGTKPDSILDAVKETLGKAGEAVKDAALDAKDAAENAVDNVKAHE